MWIDKILIGLWPTANRSQDMQIRKNRALNRSAELFAIQSYANQKEQKSVSATEVFV